MSERAPMFTALATLAFAALSPALLDEEAWLERLELPDFAQFNFQFSPTAGQLD